MWPSGARKAPYGRAHAQVAPPGREPREDSRHGVLADAARCQQARARIRRCVPESRGEAACGGAHAGRPEQVGRRDEKRALARAVEVLKGAAQLAAQRGATARRQGELLGDGASLPPDDLEHGFKARRQRTRLAGTRVEPRAGGAQPSGKGVDHGPLLFHGPADHRERLPEALLEHRVAAQPGAAHGVLLAGRERRLRLSRQLGERLVEPVGAELVACPVRSAPLDPVLPSLDGPVHDRRRQAVLERCGGALRPDHLLHVLSVRHVHDVPVVQVRELGGIPLNVVARRPAFPADVVAVDRRLVPVHVHDDVVEPRRGGRRERLGDAAGSEASLALHDVHARRVLAEVVPGADRQADRRRHAHARCPGREPDERGRRRGVPVEGLRPELLEQRRLVHGVAPEAEQVLEAELHPGVVREQVGRADPHRLVAQRPHGVQAQGLVSRGVRDHVRVLAVGMRDVVVHRVEEDSRDEPAGGDRAARVARGGDVVVHEGAQRPVDQVERFELGRLVPAQRGLARDVRHVDVARAPGSEGCLHCAFLHSFRSVGAGNRGGGGSTAPPAG